MRSWALLLASLLVLWSCDSGATPALGGAGISSDNASSLATAHSSEYNPIAHSSGESNSSSAAESAGLDPDLEAQLTPLADIASAFARQDSALRVLVRGQVTRLLSDDTSGDQHQRFIVELDDGRTILVAHNIDLAPRVPVVVGSTLYLYGEYVYNAEGGVVHWTHIDPDGSHVAGWIQLQGTRYQ
jgi:hypothetical protein